MGKKIKLVIHSERVDRIQACGFSRRIKTPTAAAKAKPPATAAIETGAGRCKTKGIAAETTIPIAIPAAPPLTLKKHRFREKLQQHMEPPRPDGHAKTKAILELNFVTPSFADGNLVH